jgi:hypothetical protein
MRHRPWSTTSALIIALLLAACRDGGAELPRRITAAGTWMGTVGAGATATMRLTMTQRGTRVTGRGSILAGAEALRLTASGSYSAPVLVLTISAPGFEPMRLSGAVAERTVTGTLSGSGFESSAVTLMRQ